MAITKGRFDWNGLCVLSAWGLEAENELGELAEVIHLSLKNLPRKQPSTLDFVLFFYFLIMKMLFLSRLFFIVFSRRPWRGRSGTASPRVMSRTGGRQPHTTKNKKEVIKDERDRMRVRETV